MTDRRPQQIIGDNAFNQLIFEGYVVTRPAAPVEGLETARREYRWGGDKNWKAYGPIFTMPDMEVRELVTRSQAEAIIAAEWAEKEAWKNASIELDKAQEAIEADNAAKVEQERLRFEGDLDKWMKIIGAGITGYQPEAYALMDLACHDFVKLRSEIAAIAGQLDCEADGDSILNIIREDKADNASLTGRVKELDQSRAEILNQQDKGWRELQNRTEALETQLAAARKALEFIVKYPRSESAIIAARAALEAKP